MSSQDYLIHYGVKGQKWGVRRYVDENGLLTEEGRRRYGYTGTGTGSAMRPAQTVVQTPKQKLHAIQKSKNKTEALANNTTAKPIDEQKKKRTRRIIAVAAGATLAAAAGYALYKGSTKWRDEMRKDINEEMGKGHESINSMHSKYWDAADRKKYGEMTKARAKFVADNTTRTDAAVAKLYEKTGIRVNVPKKREKVLAERRSQMDLSNFVRDAEKRGHQNKEIHDARASLKEAEKKLARYKNTAHIGVSKQYESKWTKEYENAVEASRKRLKELMRQRAGG